MATKGSTIRHLIREGHDDTFILSHVATTLNSVRWHRSKMRAAKVPQTEASVVALYPKTVGEAMDRFGLDKDVEACLEKLWPENAAAYWILLRKWSFRVQHKGVGRFGQCNYRQTTLEVHRTLLDHPRDLRLTFLHECAHALDGMANGRSSGHGAPWKYIMAHGFGLPTAMRGPYTREAAEALRATKMERAVETWVCSGCHVEFPIMRKRKHPVEAYRSGCCKRPMTVKAK